MKIFVALLALLCITFLGGCEPLSINNYTVPDCGCTVRMAGDAKRMPIGELDGPMYMVLYGNKLGDFTYITGYVELPGIQRQEFENSTWLKLVRTASQKTGNGKLISVKRISVDGIPGREFTVNYSQAGASPGQMARFRLVVLGARIYLVGVRTDTEKDLVAPRMDQYLDSFHITGLLPDGSVPRNKVVRLAPDQQTAQAREERARKNTAAYPELIRKIETAKSAKVFLVDTTVVHRFIEPGDRESAYSWDRCEYTTQDPAQIANLVKLIRANVVGTLGTYSSTWPSAGIFLELENGERVEFRFSETWEGPTGVFVRDETSHAPPSLYMFEKKLTFERDAYQWARSTAPFWKRRCPMDNPVNDYDFNE